MHSIAGAIENQALFPALDYFVIKNYLPHLIAGAIKNQEFSATLHNEVMQLLEASGRNFG